MDANNMYEQEVEETLAVASRIRPVKAPADLTARIMARLRQEEIGLRPLWLRLVAAAAALLLLFNVYTLTTRSADDNAGWSSSEIISDEYQIMGNGMEYGGAL